MTELITEILIYLGAAALLGLIIGYAIWGWRRRAQLAAARAEGAAAARTSVDGSGALREQLIQSEHERERLEREVSTLRHRIEAQQTSDGPRPVPASRLPEDSSAPEIAELKRELERSELDCERLGRECGLLRERLDQVQAELTACTNERERLTDANAELSGKLRGIETSRVSVFAPPLDLELESPSALKPEPQEQAEPSVASGPIEEPEPERGEIDEPVSSEADELQQSTESDEPGAPVSAPATLLAERPDEVDNLKRIKGIGPKMERILNDKGVYLFQQLANFSSSDVAWVNEAIDAFPGRIERDNWVAQAQSLYREKYGRAHDAAEG